MAQWLQGETVHELFLRVDQALYDAKNLGRDCAILAKA